MNANKPSQQPDIHSGYDLETGVLARIREWVDVFPWIRLGRTLRVAASPPLLIMVTVTCLVWWLGCGLILDQPVQLPKTAYFGTNTHTRLVPAISDFAASRNPSSIFSSFHQAKSWTRTLGSILWSLTVWMPTMLLLNRQGALLTAGREMMGFQTGLRFAAGRSPIAWLLAVIPLLCVAVFAGTIFLLGVVTNFIPFTVAPVSIVIALISVPCGILGFGATFAVPLGAAAIAVEADPDALDSLSRGYEYLYRRPLQLAFYLVVCLMIMLVVSWLATNVMIVAAQVSTLMLQFAGASDPVVKLTTKLIHAIPVIVVLTMFGSLTGGVYLLLRRDAGGQEVEDIWRPAAADSEPLPELPSAS